jgi:hypothetical protein
LRSDPIRLRVRSVRSLAGSDSIIWKRARICIACLLALSIQQSWAGRACPITLTDGSVNQDGITLTFRNKGKLPIQQVEFDCTAVKGQKAHRSTCHEDAGLFFPGNSYDMTFAYPTKGVASVLLSLSTARLSDGSSWISKRDQACHALKIYRPHRPHGG